MVPALILAAGLGTRLDPLTRLCAKAAVPLGDQTLIERLLRQLRQEGVTDVVVNLHHLPASITAVVGDGRQLGLRLRYSWEREILGSAGGPRRALPLLDADTFLIVNGDTLTDCPLGPLLEAHERSSADVTLAVVPNPAPDRYNGLRADENRRVRGFAPKGPAAEGSWHFVGIQVVAAAVFAPLPDGVPAETVAGYYRGLVAADPGRVCIYPVEAPFLDVGTPADYLEAARAYGGVDPATGSVIWPGVRVAPGAAVRRSIVATDVPAGVVATDAVLVPASVLRPDDRALRQGDVAIFPLAGLP